MFNNDFDRDMIIINTTLLKLSIAESKKAFNKLRTLRTLRTLTARDK